MREREKNRKKEEVEKRKENSKPKPKQSEKAFVFESIFALFELLFCFVPKNTHLFFT